MRCTETLHAVVSFAPEPQAAYASLGLRGYWRGYFASRSSALGPVVGTDGIFVAGSLLWGLAVDGCRAWPSA